MIKRMIIMLIVVGIVLGGIIGFEAYLPTIIKNAIASMPQPTQTVSTVPASYQEWQPTLSAVGSLRAINGADLSAEVAGIVENIDFKSGDEVPAGAVLVKLRAEDDVAKLRSMQAAADLAQIVLDRDQKQLKAQGVAQATVDSDAANLKNLRAQVDEQQATVDKKTIRAPFSGRLGIRAVDLGQYLAAGTTIVTLQQVDPIFFDFTMPQQSFDAIKIGAAVVLHIDAFPAENFTGEVSAVDPKIDPATRNVGVRASFKNPDRKLVPGMFGTVDIGAGAPRRLLTLPQTAITYSTYGDSVFVVDDKGKNPNGEDLLVARQSFVKTGATRGDQVAIESGIKEGETIVSAGQIKIHNGSPLSINNSVQPTDAANPHPVER